MKKGADSSKRPAVPPGQAATKSWPPLSDDAKVSTVRSPTSPIARSINRAYDPASLQKRPTETKRGSPPGSQLAGHLITACIAGLVVLNAVVRRWRRRPLDVKLTRAPHTPSPRGDLHDCALGHPPRRKRPRKAPRREESH